MKNPQNPKICYDWEIATRQVNYWKYSGLEIVFTNGCFDLLHLGHVQYLRSASSLGDKLVIGLNSDNSVKRIKGDRRPINDEESRGTLLAAFEMVDLVVIFEENTPLQLIELLGPDVLVKGGDYEFKNIVGKDFVESKGGRVEIIPFIKGYSTSSMIEKIKNS